MAGLADLARQIAGQLLAEEAGAFGVPLFLCKPGDSDPVLPLVGRWQDIAQRIDPGTGQTVTGRIATAAFSLDAIKRAGFNTLPVGVADPNAKPWTVASPAGERFKIVETAADDVLGLIVCHLEPYKC